MLALVGDYLCHICIEVVGKGANTQCGVFLAAEINLVLSEHLFGNGECKVLF